MSQQKGEDFIMVTEDKKLQLSYITEKEVVSTGAFNAFAVLNLDAFEIEEKEDGKRPKLAITAVLDRSGSMSGAKLDLTKTAMHFITEQLHHDDLFGIVTYDDNVATEFELTQADQKNQAFFEKKIDDIQVGGCTNLSGGLLSGIEQQIQARRNNLLDNTRSTVRAVLLCTDGLANVGIRNTQELARITKTEISDEQNLRVHTFGFGSDHDPTMLTEIADAGQGDFFFVESDDVIPEAFGNVLGGLLSVAAQNIRIVITPIQPSFKLVKVWDRVIDEKTETDGSTTISMRDLKSEGQRKLLFEYSLDKTDKEGVQDIAIVTVKYFNVATESMDEISCTLSINRKKNVPQDQPTNPEISANIARVKTTAAIDEATNWAENNDLSNARNILKNARAELTKLNLSDKNQERNLIKKLQRVEDSCQNEFEYRERGRHVSHAVNFGMQCQSAVFTSKSASKSKPKAAGFFQNMNQGFGNFFGGAAHPPPTQQQQQSLGFGGPLPPSFGFGQQQQYQQQQQQYQQAQKLQGGPAVEEMEEGEEELEGMNKFQKMFQSKAQGYSKDKTKK